MPELQTIRLDPQAHPVNRFSPNGVAAGASNANELLQLSSALTGFNQNLGRVADRRFAAHVQQEEMRAAEDVVKGRVANMKALKYAVDSGQISEQDNPWYVAKLRSLTATADAAAVGRSIQDEYFKDPISQDTNASPAAVDAWVEERLAPHRDALAQGDVWSAQAMLPAFDDIKGRIIGQHTATVPGLRETEMATAMNVRVTGLAVDLDTETMHDASTGDAIAQQRVSGAINRIQAELDDAGHSGVHWSKLNAWVANAAKDAAIGQKDAEVARRILDGVKGRDGTPLSASNKQMLQELGPYIANLKLQEERQDEERRRLAAGRESRGMMDEWKKRADAQGVSMSEIKFTFSELKGLMPETIQELENRSLALASNARTMQGIERGKVIDAIVPDLYSSFIAGKLTDDKKRSALTLLFAQGSPGSQEAKDFQQFSHFYENGDGAKETDAETYMSLREQLHAGTLDKAQLMQSFTAKKLNDRDLHYFTDQMFRQDDVSGGRRGQSAGDYEDMLKSQIAAPLIDPKNITNGVEINKLGESEEYQNKVHTASRMWDDATVTMDRDPDFRKLSAVDKHKRKVELVDSIAQRLGGITDAEYRSKYLIKPEDLAGQKPPQGMAPVAPKAKPGDGLSAMLEKADPVFAAVQPDDLKALKRSLAASWASGPVIGEQSRLAKFYGDSYQPSELHNVSKFRERWASVDFSDGMSLRKAMTGSMLYKLENDVKTPEDLKAFVKPFQTEEIKSYAMAHARIRQIKPTVEWAAGELKTLAANARVRNLEGDDAVRARDMLNSILEMQQLRREVGFTADEVKAAGPNAWKQMPLFANDLDIEQRGPAVLQKLGIPANKTTEFLEAQTLLTKEIRKR